MLTRGSVRATRTRRRDRGNALAATLFFVVTLTAAALAVVGVSNASAQRVQSDADSEDAASLGEAGLAWVVAQWQRDPDYLDANPSPAAGWSSVSNMDQPKTANSSDAGVVRSVSGKGKFTVVGVKTVPMIGGVSGRMVRITAQFNKKMYTWEAFLGPNINSPIQGVGTKGSQTWNNGGTFGATAGATGTIFANGNITVSGTGSLVTGDAQVKSGQHIYDNNTPPKITGTKSENAAAVTFPDQASIVDGKFTAAQSNTLSWMNIRDQFKTGIAGGTAPTKLQMKSANVTNINTGSGPSNGWTSSHNTALNMQHVYMEGGNVTLNAGNYAFGRLWINGGTLTINAPSTGGMMILQDLYLTNGARLIINSSGGPDAKFDVLTGKNNAFAGDIATPDGSSGGGIVKYDPTAASGAGDFVNIANASAAATMTVYNPDVNNAGQNYTTGWYQGGTGYYRGSYDGPKVDVGSQYGSSSTGSTAQQQYDDWQVYNGSMMATLSYAPDKKGVEVYQGSGADLVIAKNSRIVAGVDSSQLANLKTQTMAQIDSITQNAMGFIAWSKGGGEQPRFDLNAPPYYNDTSSANASRFTGLIYGGYEGHFGTTASFSGAFVGENFTNEGGDFYYDGRLGQLLTQEQASSKHVITKRRIDNPPAALFTAMGATAVTTGN